MVKKSGLTLASLLALCISHVQAENYNAAIFYYSRASNEYLTGAYSLALTDYGQAIAFAPNFWHGIRRSRQCLQRPGSNDLAVALDPRLSVASLAVVYSNRGNARYAAGEYDLAFSDYNRAIASHQILAWHTPVAAMYTTP